MRSHISLTLALAAFTTTVVSTPTPTRPEKLPAKRALNIPSKITNESQLESVIAGLEADGSLLVQGGSVIAEFLEAIVPSPAPASIPDAISSVASVYQAHPTDFVRSAFDLVLNGLTPSDIVDVVRGFSDTENSSNNVNSKSPNPPIYPQKSPEDAPYSVSETTLRSAIYIPQAFTYGKVPPVILIPGTGVTAGENFAPNFGKLFAGSEYADPVYLNIPGMQLADIQVESEYVAYAINYISAISDHKNVSTLSWSAGSLDGQWARTYWPSTINITSDVITISGDLHGTILADVICPPFPAVPCAPAVVQQEYNSTFVRTLRNAGGDSAYVPTTSIYSIFDEVVQPQEGDGASAFILDRNHVGVTNVELQNVCTVAQPGGTLYDHEGVLYNALAFALAKDALTHDGPADLSRIDVVSECQKIAADGLSLTDILATEGMTFKALFEILTYQPRTTTEPPIMPYAQKDIPA